MTVTMTCDNSDNDICNDKSPTNHHDNATHFDIDDNRGDVILQTHFVALNNKAMYGSYSLKNETVGLLGVHDWQSIADHAVTKQCKSGTADQNTINSGTPHGSSLSLARCLIQINAVWN